ncbi:Cys-Gln thioester bond-forming surface protein [Brevibacterium sp.]|uniref:Cys-Gln thioester bond-forming surface protein n=1 Tax=Brevibacterium sp. TaxID=1701 RepID=UPI0025C7098C|nr:Cys-Gln thioester bond-forming surface protein [Brevibacterium sp.]
MAYPEGYPRLGSVDESVQGHEIVWGDALAYPQLFGLYTAPGDTPDQLAYCIEVEVPAGYRDGMQVGGWDSFPGDNNFALDQSVRERVAWIIAHSYPRRSLETQGAAAGVTGLTQREAITATQTAIWTLTDAAPAPANFEYQGLLGRRGSLDTTSERAQRVQSVIDYLIGEANTGLPEAVRPVLTVTPEEQEGAAGEKIGPVLIEASEGHVTLTNSSDFDLVTADGTLIDAAHVPTGEEIYLNVPEDAPDGDAVLTAELTGLQYEGLLLTSANPSKRIQSLMIAHSSDSIASASTRLHWTARATAYPSETPETTETPSENPSETPEPSETPSENPSETPEPSETPSENPSEGPSETPETCVPGEPGGSGDGEQPGSCEKASETCVPGESDGSGDGEQRDSCAQVPSGGSGDTSKPGASNELPRTGMDMFGQLGIALSLLLMGAGALLFHRRQMTV